MACWSFLRTLSRASISAWLKIPRLPDLSSARMSTTWTGGIAGFTIRLGKSNRMLSPPRAAWEGEAWKRWTIEGVAELRIHTAEQMRAYSRAAVTAL